MTNVTVRFYKPSGKLYTVDHFETKTEIFENNILREETKLRFKMCDEFSYVIIASIEVHGGQQAVNEFLTIVKPETEKGFVEILAKPGSLVITPAELTYFEKFGINLPVFLRRIQKLMFNKPIIE